MLMWLSANFGTIIVGTVLAVAVVLILMAINKNKRKGKSACGGGCSSCPMAGECHSTK